MREPEVQRGGKVQHASAAMRMPRAGSRPEPPLCSQPPLQGNRRHGGVAQLRIRQVHTRDSTIRVYVALNLRSPVSGPVLRRILAVDVDPIAIANRKQDLFTIHSQISE